LKHPIVYDVVVRQEIEARDEKHAIEWLAESLRAGRVRDMGFEVIRDDNAFPPKDISSREKNGFVVLSSERRYRLFDEISAALEAAKSGDTSKGSALLKDLQSEFDYLNGGMHICR
jgi:hypothetical protein